MKRNVAANVPFLHPVVQIPHHIVIFCTVNKVMQHSIAPFFVYIYGMHIILLALQVLLLNQLK